jgi:hypothetical protein
LNRYYVYQHVRPDNGTPFYVGKGKGNRCFSTTSRNKFWHSIVKSVGFKVEIIASNLNELEAYYLEAFYIKGYGRIDSGGILVNQTDGGDGQSGSKWPESRRHYMSQKITGKRLVEVDTEALIRDYKKLSNLRQAADIHGICISTAMKYIPKDLRQQSRSKNGQLNSVRLLGKKPWNYGRSGN